MPKFEPYRDPKQPGRKDINGVEWWACDPYPTWYRWEGDYFRQDHAEWLPDDPFLALRKALILEKQIENLYEQITSLQEQAQKCRLIYNNAYVYER